MADKPVIFISATSDLRSARDLVGKVLYSMGYEPVWQEIAATEGGELLEVLRQRIAPASLVVQLVGRRYGAEPTRPTVEFGRVSYTQFEALEAERTGKKVIYHVLDGNFPSDAADRESDERASLQAAYRQGLVDANRLRYGRIASPADLELSIRRISDELAALRKQADRRHRTQVGLGIAALVAVVAVGLLAFIKFTRQEVHAAKVESKLDQQASEMAALRAAVAAAVSPKPLAAGQTQPPPILPAVLEKAKVLVARGNAEEQALGKIALKEHAEADRIIQELKSKPGNPIEEAFRLCTMEGDNWYQANEPDKAIEPYEKAVALRPRDLQARQNLVLALEFARLGDVSAKRQHAIKIAEDSLQLTPPNSTDLARIQHSLGIAWQSLPTAEKFKNLKKAIAAYEAALTVRTKEAHPTDWAATQNNLGLAWSELPTGDKTENLEKAIAAFEAALTVLTQESYDVYWATTQNNLGTAWSELPTGNKVENLKKAIAAFEAALTVRTKEAQPADWAGTQTNLGVAWSERPTGDKAENLRKAIAAYEAALTVFTKESFPDNWGKTQNNLGLAWHGLPTGDTTENLRKAIAAYEAALTVYTRESYPADWAGTQTNLGVAWSERPTGDKAENLRKAIAAYEAALTVYTKESYPDEWGKTQDNLGLAWQDLTTGDKAENVRKAIAASEAALTIHTRESYPAEWANAQNNLGRAWSSLPTGDEKENLKKGIAAYEAAISVYTKDAYPAEWATIHYNLGHAWSNLPTGDENENLKKAIAAYEAELSVFTPEAYPAKWAATQNNLGFAWYSLPMGDKTENLRKTIAAYEAALRVYTKEAYPSEWARTQCNLGKVWSDLPSGNKAENGKKAIAAYEAALSVGTANLAPSLRRGVEAGLSWAQVLAKDFAGALSTCERAPSEDAGYLPLQINHAHALLLLGRTQEARQIYVKYFGQKIAETGKSWEKTMLDDFDKLEKNGVKSPEFAK